MRDVALDNFKFILISLVVIGHAIEPLLEKYVWVKSIYVYIYLFHIPMFAYVSGAVSSRHIDNSVLNRIVTRLILPYIALEICYSLFDFYIFSRNSLIISPLLPYWILWYLFSLILWRLLLPIYDQFKYPLLLSLLTGLACGLNTYEYNLSFSRTFVFFPFFVVGHYYHGVIIKKIDQISVSRLIGSTIITITFILLVFVININSLDLGWLYGSKSYASLGTEWKHGVLNRVVIYLLAFLLGLAFLSITPQISRFYTGYGRGTLYIYVLHGFVIKGLFVLGMYGFVDSDWKVLALICGALLLVPVLSSYPVKIIAGTLINPLGNQAGRRFIHLFIKKTGKASH